MNDLLQRLRSEAPAAGLYAMAAAALILSQHTMVALACRVLGAPLAIDDMFWLFPIRQLAMRPDIPPLVAIGGFAFCLAISGILARLSLRRADRPGRGGWLERVTLVRTLQLPAALSLSFLFPP